MEKASISAAGGTACQLFLQPHALVRWPCEPGRERRKQKKKLKPLWLQQKCTKEEIHDVLIFKKKYNKLSKALKSEMNLDILSHNNQLLPPASARWLASFAQAPRSGWPFREIHWYFNLTEPYSYRRLPHKHRYSSELFACTHAYTSAVLHTPRRSPGSGRHVGRTWNSTRRAGQNPTPAVSTARPQTWCHRHGNTAVCAYQQRDAKMCLLLSCCMRTCNQNAHVNKSLIDDEIRDFHTNNEGINIAGSKTLFEQTKTNILTKSTKKTKHIHTHTDFISPWTSSASNGSCIRHTWSTSCGTCGPSQGSTPRGKQPANQWCLNCHNKNACT